LKQAETHETLETRGTNHIRQQSIDRKLQENANRVRPTSCSVAQAADQEAVSRQGSGALRLGDAR